MIGCQAHLVRLSAEAESSPLPDVRTDKAGPQSAGGGSGGGSSGDGVRHRSVLAAEAGAGHREVDAGEFPTNEEVLHALQVKVAKSVEVARRYRCGCARMVLLCRRKANQCHELQAIRVTVKDHTFGWSEIIGNFPNHT